MTEVGEQVDLLTRDELDAILSEVAQGQADRVSPLGGAFRRPSRRRSARPVRMPELKLAVQDGLGAWGKQLASRHQRRVESDLFSWEEVEVAELSETLLESDRVVHFEIEPLGAPGFLLLARPLVFGLLSCEFGGRRCAAETPERPYTRIEERFLRRTAEEVLRHLESAWSSTFPVRAKLTGLLARAELCEHATDTAMLASAEISGITSVGRLRLGLPKSPFTASEVPAAERRPGSDPGLSRMLGGVDVPLRVEIGTTCLSLAQLGSLEPGDELLLEPSSPGGFVVRVGGVPKFRATRGSVGGRLAVQVQSRIGSGER